jgi:hypothetical protein
MVEAAPWVGVSRTTLHRKFKKLDRLEADKAAASSVVDSTSRRPLSSVLGGKDVPRCRPRFVGLVQEECA